jgi:hypothetical protein
LFVLQLLLFGKELVALGKQLRCLGRWAPSPGKFDAHDSNSHVPTRRPARSRCQRHRSSHQSGRRGITARRRPKVLSPHADDPMPASSGRTNVEDGDSHLRVSLVFRSPFSDPGGARIRTALNRAPLRHVSNLPENDPTADTVTVRPASSDGALLLCGLI